MFDVCVIGHVVRDINTIDGTEHEARPGGAAYYSSMVYSTWAFELPSRQRLPWPMILCCC